MPGKVGIAPGTTTLTFDQTDVQLVGPTSGLGAVPSDFELAKMYGYLPVHSGWLVGKIEKGGGLGQATDTDEVIKRVQLQKEIEQTKAARSQRIWGAVGAMAALTGAVVGVLTLVTKRG